MNFDYESRLILKYIGGSYAYGTNVEDSDIDYRGVVIPPKSYFLGLDRFEQYERTNPDIVYYGIRKMVSLALSGNPNILECLYADQYVLMTSYGTRLLAMREEFFSTELRTRIHGICTAATAQTKYQERSRRKGGKKSSIDR